MSRHSAKSIFMKESHPCRLAATLSAALVTTAVGIMISLSFVMLIFCGDLIRYLPYGIGIMLFSMIILRTVITMLSSLPCVISDVNSFSSAILAVIAVGINNSMPPGATSTETFFTMAFAIALTSILTGLVMFFLGVLKAGEAIRYIPYPVIGGFLAATGWLIVDGAFLVMTERHLNMGNLRLLFDPAITLHWLPGLIIGIILLLVMRYWKHFLAMPVAISCAILIFYVLLFVTNTSLMEARAHGLLLDAFQEQISWSPLHFGDLPHVNWSVLFDQGIDIITIIGLSTPSLLLTAGGLELITDRHIDLNRELRAAGIANIALGLGGGLVGYQTVGDTTLAYRIGARSRLVGFCSAALCLMIMVADASIILFFPKPVLNGLLLFLGLSFLIDWLYDTFFKLPKTEYLQLLFTFFLVNTMGFMQGVGIGILMSIVLFSFDYSRKSATRHSVHEKCLKISNSLSPKHGQVLLQEDQIWVLRLREYIFFGTANSLMDCLNRKLRDERYRQPKFLVFDFSRVIGFDASAVRVFMKLRQIVAENHINLVVCSVQPEIYKILERGGCMKNNGTTCHVFPGVDKSIEWCQEVVLQPDSLESESLQNAKFMLSTDTFLK